MMEQNVGTADRYIRITMGSLMLAAGAGQMARRGGFGGGMALGALGGMMLAEGILGTCLLYSAAGINTNHQQSVGGQTGETELMGNDTDTIDEAYEGL
jgi:hypothetical protein